jgi:hypothetical protein
MQEFVRGLTATLAGVAMVFTITPSASSEAVRRGSDPWNQSHCNGHDEPVNCRVWQIIRFHADKVREAPQPGDQTYDYRDWMKTFMRNHPDKSDEIPSFYELNHPREAWSRGAKNITVHTVAINGKQVPIMISGAKQVKAMSHEVCWKYWADSPMAESWLFKDDLMEFHYDARLCWSTTSPRRLFYEWSDLKSESHAFTHKFAGVLKDNTSSVPTTGPYNDAQAIRTEVCAIFSTAVSCATAFTPEVKLEVTGPGQDHFDFDISWDT